MIIDASVAFKWLVPEPDSGIAEALLTARLFAPRLMIVEVGSALWKAVRRGEMVWSASLGRDLADLAKIISAIEDRNAIPRALEIACEIGHPIYDCVYLALAEALDDELVTADTRFVRKLAGHPSVTRVRLLAA